MAVSERGQLFLCGVVVYKGYAAFLKKSLAKNFNDAIASQSFRVNPPKTLSVVGARLTPAPPPPFGIPTTVRQ